MNILQVMMTTENELRQEITPRNNGDHQAESITTTHIDMSAYAAYIASRISLLARSCFCGRMPPEWGLCGAARGRRKGPKDGGHDARQVVVATAWMPEVERRESSCRMPGKRATGVAFFLVTSSWPHKKK